MFSPEPSTQIAISVIMPVYNVKNYIGQCLDSLINQTLKNIEIICVDDGSTDGTLQILEEYKKKDNRISIFQQQNKYAGVARNEGFKHATGKYIIFLDSDDFFKKTMLEKTYLEAEKTQAEIVLFGAKTYDDKSGVISDAPWLFIKNALPSKVPFTAKETNGNILCASTPAPWTKLYSAEYIQNLGIEYMALKNSNDVYFSYAALCCAERISYIDEALVYYRVNTGTSLQSTKKKYPLCFLDAYSATYEELNRRGIYNDVCKGFRSAVINGCVYNYESVDDDTKHVIGNSFVGEKFLRMGLLDGDVSEYYNSDNYFKLKKVVEAFSWKQKINSLKKRADAVCVKHNSIAYNPKVSVIVPCYNVENYVSACLDTLRKQTLQDIEIICINDGSTDRTLDIVLEASEADSRISVLSQKNAGLSFTRNQGVKVALGKYIYFMDSDDLLEQDALEILYNTAEKDNLDVVYFDAKCFYDSNAPIESDNSYLTYYIRAHSYASVMSGPDMLVAMGTNHEYRESACLQFINREFFLGNNLWFIPGILHEDNAFSFKTILTAQKVSHVPRTFFHRRLRDYSITSTKVKFAHAYGQFISGLNMMETARNKNLTSDQEAAVALVLRDVIGHIREKYLRLSEDEKQVFYALSPIEQELFKSLVISEPSGTCDLSTSASYRIGRAITFIPRMLRAVLRNLKAHGLAYTAKRCIWKLKTLLGK